MGKPASIIDINGSRYDAASGRIIGAAKKLSPRFASPDQAIDGFVKKQARPKPAPKKTEAKAKPVRPARTVKSSAKSVHARTRRSETLRRNISRPSLRIKEASKTFARPVITAATTILPDRERRAKLVDKHDKVSRFGAPKTVDAEPTKAPTVQVVTPRPRPNAAARAASFSPPASMVTSASHARLERMLDAALVNAKSHKQLSRQRKGLLAKLYAMPRWLSWTLLAAIAVIAVGFILWQDVPAVAVKVASARAHVNASMPSYAPVGFSYAGPVKYSPGSVSITFKDGMNGSQQYSVIEQKSSWNSASLSNNVLGNSLQYQTSQVGGTTVYIYGSSNDATWVSNGVWYTIHNQAGLSSDQLLRIVGSL